jgi:hypothetical protein
LGACVSNCRVFFDLGCWSKGFNPLAGESIQSVH